MKSIKSIYKNKKWFVTEAKEIQSKVAKCFQNLDREQQGCFNNLVHAKGAGGIVKLSQSNLQKLDLKIYNEDKPKTELNRPLSLQEEQWYKKVQATPFVLGHKTEYPYEVACDKILFSKKKLKEIGKPGYGLTNSSDNIIFGNTGFVFFNYFARGSKLDFSSIKGDVFLSADILYQMGYTTLMDGFGVYQNLHLGQESVLYTGDNTVISTHFNGLGSMDIIFKNKKNGEISVLPMTFGESHAFGGDITEFLAKVSVLKLRRLDKEDRDVMLQNMDNPGMLATQLNQLLPGLEAKLPVSVKLGDNVLGVSERYRKVQEHVKNGDTKSYTGKILQERQWAEDNSKYKGSSYD